MSVLTSGFLALVPLVLLLPAAAAWLPEPRTLAASQVHAWMVASGLVAMASRHMHPSTLVVALGLLLPSVQAGCLLGDRVVGFVPLASLASFWTLFLASATGCRRLEERGPWLLVAASLLAFPPLAAVFQEGAAPAWSRLSPWTAALWAHEGVFPTVACAALACAAAGAWIDRPGRWRRGPCPASR